ncbi:sodium:proton antiporter [Thermoleophilia bacterium SCSIO 60948]|nr:sodium:proton antiporter [Thermoleophilia bacterium SCSIO 60948]
MNLAFALAAAVLFGTGAYLLLNRDLVRVALGVVLISQAATLTIVASGLSRGEAPIYPFDDAAAGETSDPLTQAMALTAIVIGFAVVALLLVLILRTVTAFRSRELDEIASEEAARDAELEREDAGEHDREEAAAE